MPRYLVELFELYNPVRDLRSANQFKLEIPNLTTKLSKRSFAYQGSYLWNIIPLSIRTSQTLSVFKKKLKPHLLSHQVNSHSYSLSW